jgi:hypothetical protein
VGRQSARESLRALVIAIARSGNPDGLRKVSSGSVHQTQWPSGYENDEAASCRMELLQVLQKSLPLLGVSFWLDCSPLARSSRCGIVRLQWRDLGLPL